MAFNIRIPYVIASHVKKYASTASLVNRSKAAAMGWVTNVLYFHDGTAARAIVDVNSAQVLVSKTLTSPIVNGTVQTGVAAAAGATSELAVNKVLTDNTATDFFTITIPNAIAGASLRLYISSTLGDGDSTDTAVYTVGISRIAGAAGKATISAKSVIGATAGAGANAVITATVTGMTGGNTVAQTFTVQIKNARSAGAADNHPTTAVVKLFNNKAAGITIVGA